MAPLRALALGLCWARPASALRTSDSPFKVDCDADRADRRRERRGVRLFGADELPQCAAWQQQAVASHLFEGPLAFQGAGADFWRATSCPLSRAAVAAAASPAGHEGARLRLQQALARSLRGEALEIAVLGGSMTAGNGANRPWPGILQELLRGLGLNATVTNLARPASTSEWGVGNFGRLVPDLSRAHLLIVDYGINDGDYAYRVDSYRSLAQMLIDLPQRPAVVGFETWFDLEPGGESCGSADIASYPHFGVNQELQLPMVSYRDAVCGSGRTFWMQQGGKVDVQGKAHPGDITHDLCARTILGALSLEVDKLCEAGVAGADYPSRSRDNVTSPSTRCLAQDGSVFRRHAMDGPAAFAPASVSESAWKFQEDVPGKPGWIAQEGQVGEISFDVETKEGWLQLEYLGSYRDIGSVSVWLDHLSGLDNRCRLTGLWREHSSQARFSLLRLRLPPGRHRLSLRSERYKFKLLGITAC